MDNFQFLHRFTRRLCAHIHTYFTHESTQLNQNFLTARKTLIIVSQWVKWWAFWLHYTVTSSKKLVAQVEKTWFLSVDHVHHPILISLICQDCPECLFRWPDILLHGKICPGNDQKPFGQSFWSPSISQVIECPLYDRLFVTVPCNITYTYL